MIARFLQSFALAIGNIRSNFFHTLLSVLGIVIGVGALVSILSLIDGMERFAKDQISSTTDLNVIVASSQTTKMLDGISVRKDTFTVFEQSDFLSVKTDLSRPSSVYLFNRTTSEIWTDDEEVKIAAHITAVAGLKPDTILLGRIFIQDQNEAMISEPLAKSLAKGKPLSDLIDKSIRVGERSLKVVGIAKVKSSKGAELFLPFDLLSKHEITSNPPQLAVVAENVTDVPALKSDLENYLKSKFPNGHDFQVTSNELRVEQAMKGIGLFRIIMGLIVGISVVVGGVGVMNVLLISVNERTAEIGIRKAMGANRKDIVMLFLSESIAVSVFGSFLGLIFGVLFTMAAIPIVKAATKIPFQAEYTLNTLLVISALAVLVGIIFGTYPALRASRLNPVDAIRHE